MVLTLSEPHGAVGLGFPEMQPCYSQCPPAPLHVVPTSPGLGCNLHGNPQLLRTLNPKASGFVPTQNVCPLPSHMNENSDTHGSVAPTPRLTPTT